MRLDLNTEHLFDIEVDLRPENDVIGQTPVGMRMIANITGGTFDGPRLRGTVLPSGADWLFADPTGTFHLDVRLTLQTDDDALIYVTYNGRLKVTPEQFESAQAGNPIDPADIYFRTAPFFETAAPQYAWLNDIVSIGVGRMINADGRNAVGYSVYQVL